MQSQWSWDLSLGTKAMREEHSCLKRYIMNVFKKGYKDMKRTNLKVRVKNGTTYFERSVYELNGTYYFKHGGENYEIYPNGKGGIRANWFPCVEFIAE